MIGISDFYYISIASAFVISGVFFYCTHKFQIRYSDNEVEQTNIEMRQRNNSIIETNHN